MEFKVIPDSDNYITLIKYMYFIAYEVLAAGFIANFTRRVWS